MNALCAAAPPDDYDPYRDPNSPYYDPYADPNSVLYDPYLDPDSSWDQPPPEPTPEPAPEPDLVPIPEPGQSSTDCTIEEVEQGRCVEICMTTILTPDGGIEVDVTFEDVECPEGTLVA